MHFFFFNNPATTEISTLSLHDALPISVRARPAHRGDRELRRLRREAARLRHRPLRRRGPEDDGDRKSTRLNSSHANISYAVFCLKKKTNTHIEVYINIKCTYLNAPHST